MNNLARVVAILFAFALPLALAAEPSAAIGSWTLNLAKSKYEPTAATPRSETRTYEVEGDSVKLTVRTEAADGGVRQETATYQADQKPYPLSGNPGSRR